MRTRKSRLVDCEWNTRAGRREGGERFHDAALIQASIAASAYTRACLSYFKLGNSIPRETTVLFSLFDHLERVGSLFHTQSCGQ